MKFKNMLMILGLGLLFFLVGCIGNEDEPNLDAENINLIIAWIDEQIPATITEDITLPTTHPELGGVIEWLTYDPHVIADTGEITPPDGTEEVMIEYTVTLGELIRTHIIEILVVGKSVEDIAEAFIKQFAPVITRNYNLNTRFYNEFDVTWSSSNEEVFTNQGVYIQPVDSVMITIHYSVSFLGETHDFSHDIEVRGMAFSQKATVIREWVQEQFLTTRVVDSEFSLPTVYEPFNAQIVWDSSNPDVVAADGTITQYAFDRYVSLDGAVHIGDDLMYISFPLIVKADPTITTKEAKLENFLDAIGVSSISRLTFEYYNNINQSFNHILFYEQQSAPYTTQIMPLGGSRPGTKLPSLEIIVIHDTANQNAGAQAHANLLSGGYSAASWHFQIDDKGIWQSIPLDEYAWHAGDGGRVFTLNDTGVKATGEYPRITISNDGYYELNGERSTIKAPTNSGILLTTNHIVPSGIYTEIGPNGNYLMNSTYYNGTYNRIANFGGRSSVGIETCVNQGSDYPLTLRYTAEIVATMLIDNNLPVSRVVQHNNMSGKDCPLTVRRTNYWDIFLDMVSMEKFAQEELADVTFNWTSLTPSILSNNGTIARNIGGASEVRYSVTASFGTTTVEKQYTTILG